MLFVMVAVDEFRQLVRRFRMLFIDVLDLRVRLFVDEQVQKIDEPEPDGRHAYDKEYMPHRTGRLPERVRKQIEAHDAHHDAARKT